ncbi:MAG: sigma-54-dependent transcriptional regulator, partial [Burkholderiales bacterium]
MTALPILVVEDDRDLCEALCETLKLAGYRVESAASGVQALAALKKQQVALVVSDVQMRPMDGHALLREIKSAYPHVPVLLMTAYGVIERAVEAMRAGACHYLTKPFEPETLLAEVARHMLPVLSAQPGEFLTYDPNTSDMLEQAKRAAASNATVLITGESGSGKEVLARFIHC